MQGDEGRKEEKQPLLSGEKPLRIEPRRGKKESEETVKTSPRAVSPMEESKEEELGLNNAPLENKPEEPIYEATTTSSRLADSLFPWLFSLSLVLMAVALGILLLPILGIPIPDFLTPAINFASKFTLP